MQLELLVPKGPIGPSNSTICPRTAPKRPPKAPEFVHIGRHIGCLLLATCLLAKRVRCTLDTKEGYKTQTGSTSSVTAALTLALGLTLG